MVIRGGEESICVGHLITQRRKTKVGAPGRNKENAGVSGAGDEGLYVSRLNGSCVYGSG